MYTFNKMWGVVTPEEASVKIEEQRKEAGITEPKNLEEQAISLVGRDIYEKLIKGYTEKQWGRDCKDLPSFIIKRLPVRLTFDNNYFNALYQGIPVRCWRTVHIREIYSLICKACSHGKPWLLCYLAKTQLTFLAHFVILKLHIWESSLTVRLSNPHMKK